MGAGDDIPEERLLRLIEKGEAGAVSAAPVKMTGWKGVLNRLAFLQRFGVRAPDDRILFTLKSLSGLVWLVLAGLGLYFLAGVVPLPLPGRFEHKQASLAPRAVSDEPQPAQALALKPEEYYLEPLGQRNPFTNQSSVTEEEPAEAPPTPAEVLHGMAEGLSVVGINRGAVPDAIVEDVVNKKSYFIKAGDKVKDMTVKEIKHNSVVLTYQGEDIEIS
ncbi:MAG TPA: hypothetical protein VL688_10840 [Verrucomicrobiae bacterium]|jgi:hypothetical protein|nr:hypothetical protein [Verrucomicrobiae bacterium]